MGKFFIIGLVLLTTMVQECKKDSTGPDGGIPSALVGTWYASSFTFTNKANPAQTVNELGAGTAFMLVINDDGTFIATYSYLGSAVETNSGTMSVSGAQITAKEDSSTTIFSYIIVGGVLTITSQDESYDFNNDGTDEAAILTIVLSHTAPSTGGGVPTQAVGTWSASSYIYVNNANSSQTHDDIAAGSSLILTISSSGSYSSTRNDPGSTSPDVENGTLSFSGNMVTVTNAGGSMVVAWAISGNTMTLQFQDTYDFNNDGTDEAATVTIVLTRQ